MRRTVTILISVFVLVGITCLPALFNGGPDDDGDTESEPTSITQYDATFDVADDGDLDVVETITVDFPVDDRHGIFRFWDLTDTTDPHTRLDVEDLEVTMDGRDVPVDASSEQGGQVLVAKIGDADRTVSTGQHVYEISYHLDGVLVPGDLGRTDLYWDLVPSGWRQTIDQARLTVNLPSPAGEVRCGVGLGESPRDCDRVEGAGTETLTVTASDLDANTPVTLRAGLDMATPEAGLTLPWTSRWDRVLGKSLVGLGVVGLLALGAALLGGLAARRSYEATPPFPLMYAPPEGIGPAQANYILNEGVDREAYVATLMYAAEKGAVDLDKDGDVWTITDKGGQAAWAELDPVTTTVAHLLGGPGSSFKADPEDVEAGKRLQSEIESFEKATRSWAEDEGHVVSTGFGGVGGLVVLVAFLLAIANVIFNPFTMTALSLVPGAFAIFASPLLRPGSGTKRTASGRDLWSRVGGFHRVLSTDSSVDRFDFSGRQELYTAYIPWAVALGVADQWAARYRTEMGVEPPTPSYFAAGYGGAYAGSVSSMVDDFDSTVGRSISSYEATQSSSSSGGGGGGFSGGGGGGGGGGGSW
ncbi:DUF2207 domain-containing protein [Nocardioides lijunqiniae]|uniref:DUF2207 domain-containing protein n=1 Tax=Nocardioides lijunqiniae TaxID=2760832 RepID=UPI0018786E01|nr:DUF2207 domain-containing protein [Nocardioides lijunqiniae]